MSSVSCTGLQQYPAKGPVIFAVGTDFGIFLTFSWSVFKTLKLAFKVLVLVGEDMDGARGAGGAA